MEDGIMNHVKLKMIPQSHHYYELTVWSLLFPLHSHRLSQRSSGEVSTGWGVKIRGEKWAAQATLRNRNTVQKTTP